MTYDGRFAIRGDTIRVHPGLLNFSEYDLRWREPFWISDDASYDPERILQFAEDHPNIVMLKPSEVPNACQTRRPNSNSQTLKWFRSVGFPIRQLLLLKEWTNTCLIRTVIKSITFFPYSLFPFLSVSVCPCIDLLRCLQAEDHHKLAEMTCGRTRAVNTTETCCLVFQKDFRAPIPAQRSTVISTI